VDGGQALAENSNPIVSISIEQAVALTSFGKNTYKTEQMRVQNTAIRLIPWELLALYVLFWDTGNSENSRGISKLLWENIA
jgi:hypothetical protein